MIMEKSDENMKQQVILVSDSTGITVEAVAQSLLAQFPGVEFDVSTHRYMDSPAKIDQLCSEITGMIADSGQKPIIISTLVDGPLRTRLEKADGFVFDIMGDFLTPLEEILHSQARALKGKTHGQYERNYYQHRMDAVNFALLNDDGITDKHLASADVILIGPSRTGKTPTSLYLAMQYGIYAANYPLVEEDFELMTLPNSLKPYRTRCFGLTIDPQRLHEIREARRAGSEYASLSRCSYEVNQVNAMYQEFSIPSCDVTQRSVEEIATTILPYFPVSA
jgi:regulator of PEP synthase PpsR (kinase-PPPase family)